MSASEFVEARQRTLLNVDRRTGNDPLSISSLGDQRTLWASTGLLANGATKRIYLTVAGTSGAPAVWDRIPAVTVYVRDGGGVLARADAPLDPSTNMNLQMVATWELIWVGSNKTWVVDVTNEIGSSRDFLIRAEGL
jgi:hypothetical protein